MLKIFEIGLTTRHESLLFEVIHNIQKNSHVPFHLQVPLDILKFKCIN